MDLSFARFDRGIAVTPLPTELAVLLAAATGRQAATPTARLQTRLAWKRAPVSLLNPCVATKHRSTAKHPQQQRE